MIRILMICLGNICRSPMAEALLRKKIRDAGLEGRIEVDSAGTYHGHQGERPHRGTVRELQRHGVPFDGIASRQVAIEDLDEMDYLIVMDVENLNDLRGMARKWGRAAPDSHMIMEFASRVDEGPVDVPDPYYERNFDRVYEMLDDATDGLLAHVRRQNGL